MIVLALWLSLADVEAPPTPRGEVAWTAELPGTPSRGCAVDEARVFQGVMRPVDRKERALLVAVDRTSGRLAWQKEVGTGYPHAAPATVGALVV